MSIVLDASATVALIYEERPQADLAALYAEVRRSGALVPQIWRVEIANVLLTGLRKGRHDLSRAREYIAALSQLTVSVDEQTQAKAWGSALDLAAVHNLTSYDAPYLELAKRRKAVLATEDKALIRAAEAENVPLFWK